MAFCEHVELDSQYVFPMCVNSFGALFCDVPMMELFQVSKRVTRSSHRTRARRDQHTGLHSIVPAETPGLCRQTTTCALLRHPLCQYWSEPARREPPCRACLPPESWSSRTLANIATIRRAISAVRASCAGVVACIYVGARCQVCSSASCRHRSPWLLFVLWCRLPALHM